MGTHTFNIGQHQSMGWDSGLCKKKKRGWLVLIFSASCLWPALHSAASDSSQHAFPTMLSCILDLWMHQVSCIHILPWDLPSARDLTFPLFSLLCGNNSSVVGASPARSLSFPLIVFTSSRLPSLLWDLDEIAFHLIFVFVGCLFVLRQSHYIVLASLILNADRFVYHRLPSAGLGGFVFVFWVKVPLLCRASCSRASYVIGLASSSDPLPLPPSNHIKCWYQKMCYTPPSLLIF